jgi:hypothetical protein
MSISRLAAAAALFLAGSAMATIHDTFTFTSQVSNGVNGSPLNEVATASTLNAYSVGRVRVNGTLVSGGVNSYESEARILVTPPNGSPFTLQPFSQAIPFGTISTPEGGYVYDLPPGFPNAHGTWTFRFYESFDDPGIDATWQTISFSLDDASTQENLEVHPTATPAIAGLNPTLMSLYLVPGLNPGSTGMAVTVDLSGVGGSATQPLNDNGGSGDAVAGDHFYSLSYTPPASVAEGVYTINYHATDAQGRNVYGSFPLEVQGVEEVPALQNGYVYDLGVDVAAGGVHWFKVTLPHQAAAVTEGWFDMWTWGPTSWDTEIGLYNASGQLMAYDDDDGDGVLSALSFGQATPQRQWFTADGLPGDGRDGALPAGTYYLAFGMYPMTFGQSNFAVTSGGPAGYLGGVAFTTTYNTPPTVAANPYVEMEQASFVIDVQATPGTDPVSQGLTVFADLTSIGGGSSVQLYDDGTHGDWTAGDNTFSLAYTLPASVGEGTYQIPLIVRDSLFRQSTGTYTLYVDAAGQTPGAAKVLDGPGPITSVSGVITRYDVDMFRIHVCDPSHFSATVTAADFDSELYFFRLDGTGVAQNDDVGGTPYSNLSRVSGALVSGLAPGDYLLAICPYPDSPTDAGSQHLWSAFGEGGSVVAPNGPGAGNPMTGWDISLTSGTGNYTIAFTGVAGAACGPHCGSADFNCDGSIGTDADIEAFFACIAGNCPPPPCTSTADFNGDGAIGTDADIEAFFRVLSGGPC